MFESWQAALANILTKWQGALANMIGGNSNWHSKLTRLSEMWSRKFATILTTDETGFV